MLFLFGASGGMLKKYMNYDSWSSKPWSHKERSGLKDKTTVPDLMANMKAIKYLILKKNQMILLGMEVKQDSNSTILG